MTNPADTIPLDQTCQMAECDQPATASVEIPLWGEVHTNYMCTFHADFIKEKLAEGPNQYQA